MQKVIEYRGREILKRDDKYFVDGVSFLNLGHAQGRVDQLVEGKVNGEA